MSKPDANILEDFVVPERKARFDRVASQRTAALTVVLDHVKNYHNISAVLRSADAFGIAGVHLVGPVHEFSRGISLGAERWVELTRHDTAADAAEVLKSQGYRLVMLQPEDDDRGGARAGMPSLCVTDLPFEQKLALVFGNEINGVSQDFVNAVDLHAYIPMFGFVESLNISVACAITLFCATLGSATMQRRTPTLGCGEQAVLKQVWLTKSACNAELILREVSRREDEE